MLFYPPLHTYSATKLIDIYKKNTKEKKENPQSRLSSYNYTI